MPPVQRFDIADGGVLLLDSCFLPPDEAHLLLDTLRTKTPWKQEIGSFGRPFPRLTAYYADEGVTYRYSGVAHEAQVWPDYLLELRRRIEDAAQSRFNSLLLNYYRDGNDSIGYHADDEPELGINPIIASLSLGTARTFHLRHLHSRERQSFQLPHGSLLVMAGTTQHHWQHALPKTATQVGERINLTLREIRSTN